MSNTTVDVRRAYYTIDRTAEEVLDVWDWASMHDSPYHTGIIVTLEYIAGIHDNKPQDLLENMDGSKI